MSSTAVVVIVHIFEMIYSSSNDGAAATTTAVRQLGLLSLGAAVLCSFVALQFNRLVDRPYMVSREMCARHGGLHACLSS